MGLSNPCLLFYPHVTHPDRPLPPETDTPGQLSRVVCPPVPQQKNHHWWGGRWVSSTDGWENLLFDSFLCTICSSLNLFK
ncbi:hypothetical protein BC937DRAFT_92850 [Endogone sp. FLAS-F59071]|nr:hypothetical protein BC937DRAFT_92850 [Endogone sp. FLAS-F59071]|eukprot:RUS15140.1 hypothetical protein BC937DRAFT_92850 [Endogone sp. FLAS-F59071]